MKAELRKLVEEMRNRASRGSVGPQTLDEFAVALEALLARAEGPEQAAWDHDRFDSWLRRVIEQFSHEPRDRLSDDPEQADPRRFHKARVVMTREELDRLQLLYREDFGTAEHGEFVTLMHENWHALIAQARRAIELEEALKRGRPAADASDEEPEPFI